MASFEARPIRLPCPYTRTRCAPKGTPRTRRADDGKVRRMARRMRASSPQAQGCAFGEPRRPFANPEHMDVLRTCSRGGLSLGHLSLATQRKVARPPGRRAKKDRDVEFKFARRPRVRPPSALRAPLLGSRIRRSPSNPALGILPRAFEPARTAAGSSQAPTLTPQAGEGKTLTPPRDTPAPHPAPTRTLPPAPAGAGRNRARPRTASRSACRPAACPSGC